MQLPQFTNEAQTRQQFIEQQLLNSGWRVSKGNLLEELHLTNEGVGIAETRAAIYRIGNEFVDYVMLGQDGKPIGLVEAKRSSRDAFTVLRLHLLTKSSKISIQSSCTKEHRARRLTQ